MLTASIKKSWCITLTTPKLVNLNILSIIHMTLGRICFLALKHAISIGTSAVDWWLANTNVLSSKHCDMSSPISTTETKSSPQYRNVDTHTTRPGRTYFRIPKNSSTSRPWPAASGRSSPLSARRCPALPSAGATGASSRRRTSGCSRRCSASRSNIGTAPLGWCRAAWNA